MMTETLKIMLLSWNDKQGSDKHGRWRGMGSTGQP